MTEITQKAAVEPTTAAASFPAFLVKIVDPAGAVEFLAADRCRCEFEDGALLLRYVEPDVPLPVELRLEGRGWHVFVMNGRGDTIEQIHGRARGTGGPPR